MPQFHPLVERWFREHLGEPSAPQRDGWPAIAAGDHTLILAPTGTGKTLAAFLWELNQLITSGLDAPLANAIQILYISPLKALNNDVERNLRTPLLQLAERFAAAGQDFPEIRVAVRTGDTPASARARMLRKTPHVLITTPESLHIMLTSVRGRGMFSGVRAVIVDEIHAIAGTKRGAHLALTLERLERLTDEPPQRIGLSATQRPLDEIARFLGGARPVTVVDCGMVKSMEISVESPVDDLNHVPAGSIWPTVAVPLLRHIRSAKTTLVFVNNRAQAEKMAARINALAGEELALPYHGSLSRERRLTIEDALKGGLVRALVTTSSLELGIDVGSVELVVQVQSAKRVASGLQRVGRAGHSLGAASRGVLMPTFRDDALETVALANAMREGDVEPTTVVQNALDVLSQVIVAVVSIDDDWTADSLFDLVRSAYPYHALSRSAYTEVLEMLSGKYPADVASELDARITWDRVSGRLAATRASRMIAVISGGTIPDRGLYTVHLPDRTRIGELDEEFVHETRIGDVFQLGSSTWRVHAIEHDRVIVIPAPGAPARMPFWHGEYAARSSHLAARIGTLRRALTASDASLSVPALQSEYGTDEATMRSLVEYVRQQRVATGAVPDDRSLILEQFHDEMGALRVVLHTPFGGRVNAPWGMALAHRVREWLGERSGSFELQVQTNDDGIMLRLPSLERPLPADLVRELGPDEAERRILHEIGSSSLFGARFRMNAARALLLPRGSPRRRMPLWLQRLKALDLLQAVREHPSFPILVESYRDVMSDAFDMPALRRVLSELHGGSISLQSVSTDRASPFAASLQFGFVMDWLYSDDAPRAESRAALLSLDRAMLDEVLGSEAADAETLQMLDVLLARRRGAAPGARARTADELSILVDRAGDLTLAEIAERVAPGTEGRRGDPLAELLDQRRLIGVELPTAAGPTLRLTLVETLPRYLSTFGEGILATLRVGPSLDRTSLDSAVPAQFRRAVLSERAARGEILSRFVALAGVVSVSDVRARYDLDATWIEARFDAWARDGKLVRGTFGVLDGVSRWCSRRLIEQARHRELARARRAIEAVDIAVYARFLERWQHVDPTTRLDGDDGTATIVRQLLGVARPADWWTRDAIAARVRRPSRDAISRAMANGELSWAARPAADPAVARVGPIVLFRRGTGHAWLPPSVDPAVLTSSARAVFDTLAARGATFVDEIGDATSLSARQLRDALRELVAAGLVTSDSLDAIRAVVRWKPMPAESRKPPVDPTRWIPASVDGESRLVVQRRPSARRLPKWRRPDLDDTNPDRWPGRWSLVHVPGVLGPERDESTWAEVIARQWLDRYGIVSREWWRRDRPPIPWRAIYRELRRLEMRGEAKRGYFVRGLSGAQFAHPDAVDRLRAPAGADASVIVLTARDPANPYQLDLLDESRDSFARPRGRGAVVATLSGIVVLVVESRGSTMRVRPGTSEGDVTRAVRAVAAHLSTRGARPRDVVVETINGQRAATSEHYPAFAAAGFRRTTRALRFLATPSAPG